MSFLPASVRAPSHPPQAGISVIGPDPAFSNQAADGPRTRDLKLGKLALYQLSYHRAEADITPLEGLWHYASPLDDQTFPHAAADRRGRCRAGRAARLRGRQPSSPNARSTKRSSKGTIPRRPRATTSMPLLSGAGKRTLASYRGHVVVLNFWASWCTPCQEEAPILERAQHTLARRGGTVLGVTFRDSSPDSLGFVKHYGSATPTCATRPANSPRPMAPPRSLRRS